MLNEVNLFIIVIFFFFLVIENIRSEIFKIRKYKIISKVMEWKSDGFK